MSLTYKELSTLKLIYDCGKVFINYWFQ